MFTERAARTECAIDQLMRIKLQRVMRLSLRLLYFHSDLKTFICPICIAEERPAHSLRRDSRVKTTWFP